MNRKRWTAREQDRLMKHVRGIQVVVSNTAPADFSREAMAHNRLKLKLEEFTSLFVDEVNWESLVRRRSGK